MLYVIRVSNSFISRAGQPGCVAFNYQQWHPGSLLLFFFSIFFFKNNRISKHRAACFFLFSICCPFFLFCDLRCRLCFNIAVEFPCFCFLRCPRCRCCCRRCRWGCISTGTDVQCNPPSPLPLVLILLTLSPPLHLLLLHKCMFT
jgi:hypothetical protein